MPVPLWILSQTSPSFSRKLLAETKTQNSRFTPWKFPKFSDNKRQ